MTAIIVTACNRAGALGRLLRSLERCRGIEEITLIVSVDAHPDAAASVDTAREARGARVVTQPARLGLYEHFFHGGDLVAEHETVILLEDDLYASADLLDYVRAALDRYAAVPEIAALSLSAFAFHEAAEAPFAPVDDGYDVYFTQSAGWGLVFTHAQWSAFRSWATEHAGVRGSPLLPDEMNSWPEPTWKRLLNLFFAQERKYVVVPRIGLIANLAEKGVHASRAVTYLTTPLSRGRRTWRMPAFNDSLCRYDAFLQLEAESLRQWSQVSLPESLAVDLYCQRGIAGYDAEWVVTSRHSRRAERSFGLRLFPFEENVIDAIPGDDLVLARCEDVLPEPRAGTLERMRSFFIPPWR
jgi:hypothetical protein